MNIEQLLKENKHLNDIYRGLDVKTEIESHLDDFNAGYLAGYRGAMLANFDGFLDMLVDIANGVDHDETTCKFCERKKINEPS
jgi:hypothetical protein